MISRSLAAFLILNLTLALLLGGCASKQTPSVLESEATGATQEALDENAYHHYTNAVIYEQEQMYAEAVEEYQRALSYEPLAYDIRLGLGQLYYRLGKPGEAVNAVLPLTVKDAEIYLLLGDSYRHLGQTVQSQQAYEQVLKERPDDVEVNYQLGIDAARAQQPARAATYFSVAAHSSLSAEVFEQAAKAFAAAGEYDSAAVYFRHAIDASVADPAIYGRAAYFCGAADRRDDAVRLLQEGLELYPDAVRLSAQLIELYLAEDKLDSVQTISEEMLQVESDDFAAYERIGQLLLKRDLPELASRFFSGALTADSSSVPALFYLGRMALEAKQLDSAAYLFSRLIDVDPGIPDGWINLALIYGKQEETDTAIALLETALDSVTVHRDDLRFLLSQLLDEKSLRDSALVVLQDIIKEGGDTVQALFNIGALYERMGQFDKSVESFELLLSIDSAHAQALNYLGYMFADHNVRLDESLDMIERALLLDSPNGAYIDSYAWVLYRLERYEDALEQIEQAIILMPDDPIVNEHLGDIHSALGNQEDAATAWQRALSLDPDNPVLKEKLAGN